MQSTKSCLICRKYILNGVPEAHLRPGLRHAQASSSLAAKVVTPFGHGQGGSSGWRISLRSEAHLKHNDFCYFLRELNGPTLSACRGCSVCSAERWRGRVAVHPCRPGRSVDISLLEKGLCRIIEGVNGRNTDQANEAVSLWPERYHVGAGRGQRYSYSG